MQSVSAQLKRGELQGRLFRLCAESGGFVGHRRHEGRDLRGTRGLAGYPDGPRNPKKQSGKTRQQPRPRDQAREENTAHGSCRTH